MVTIKVNIGWCNKNYAASVDEQVPGAVVATDKTFEGVKKAIAEAVAFHVEGMKADGDSVPEWLSNGDYQFEWILEVSALLRNCEQYTSIAAISRASGINEQLLSHYANGRKTPRAKQRERIIDGIHKIGQEFMSVM
jgi:predicted RNase H-like HicB family nuclease